MPEQLKYGVEFDGAVHSQFDLRLPTIADNIAVVDECPNGSALELNVAILARCLTRLGEIPLQQVQTPGWLASVLIDDDYDVLWDQLQTLKKKRLLPSNADTESSSPS